MKLKTGDSTTQVHRITESEVLAFAKISGDHNPIHVDEAFARTTPFGARIAHGMFVGSLISAILATRLPGPGSIYLSQTFKFLRPAFLGEEISIPVTVLEVLPDKPIVRLETKVLNAKGESILEGEAVAKVPNLER